MEVRRALEPTLGRWRCRGGLDLSERSIYAELPAVAVDEVKSSREIPSCKLSGSCGVAPALAAPFMRRLARRWRPVPHSAGRPAPAWPSDDSMLRSKLLLLHTVLWFNIR